MTRRRLAPLLGAAVLAAGCGAPAPDLFEVRVSGPDRNANYTLLVADDGRVRCNEAAPRSLGEERLLEARELARDLSRQAELAIELPPARNSILRYRARMEAGEVAFSDSSPGRPRSFSRLMAFSTDVAENVCGLER